MSFEKYLAITALALLPFLANAQQKQPQPGPTDADAPITAFTYESAFKNYRTTPEESETPDKVWRSVNDEVGRLGGHGGHMKDDDGEAASPAPEETASPQGGAANHGKHH